MQFALNTSLDVPSGHLGSALGVQYAIDVRVARVGNAPGAHDKEARGLVLEGRRSCPFVEVALEACPAASALQQTLVSDFLVGSACRKEPGIVLRQARSTTKWREAASIAHSATPHIVLVNAPLSAETFPRRRPVGDAITAGGGVVLINSAIKTAGSFPWHALTAP